MEKHIETLSSIKLFSGIEPDDIHAILSCCLAKAQACQKGAALIHEGSLVTNIGILLEGAAQAIKTDASGKQLVISRLEKGALFGDILSAGERHVSPVTVYALDAVEVLMLPYEKIIGRCAKACQRHDLLLRNLLYIISDKYFELHDRINCMIRPTLREKIMQFLEVTAKRQGSSTFNIPFDRNAMAEYLNADRSALSRELSAMKADGIIDYYKNTFRVL